MNLENGKLYNVNHRRKGKFVARYVGIDPDPEFAKFYIENGHTKTRLPKNSRGPREFDMLRKSFYTFELIEE